MAANSWEGQGNYDAMGRWVIDVRSSKILETLGKHSAQEAEGKEVV